MADVIATKKGVSQRFSEHAWNLLGANKHGWVADEGQIIQNATTTQPKAKTEKPSTGQRQPGSQVIGNKLDENKGDTQTQNKGEDSAGNSSDSDKSLTKEDLEQAKKDFLEKIKGFNKGTIKDHFDLQNPPIEYNNSWNIDKLKDELGKLYKWNIDLLQKAFNP